MPIILELAFHSDSDDQHPLVDARLSMEENATDQVLAHGVPIALDMPQLLACSLDPIRYGSLLSAMLFADPRLRRAWGYARSYADAMGLPLTIGFRIMDSTSSLHGVGWEMLCDPETGHRLGLSERVLLVRYCDLDRPLPVVRHQRRDVGQVIAVASPKDLPDYGLPALPTQTIVAGARSDDASFASIVLDGSSAFRRVTLPRIVAAMRGGPRMLYLVCHGSSVDGETYLWLEDEAGYAQPTAASAVVEALSGLGALPPLIAILACGGAGQLHGGPLPQALGPQLINTGAPAVLLFRDNAPLDLGRSLMPVFWHELARDGMVARALGAARSQATDSAWAQPVLWTRVRDGYIWA